MNAKVKLQKTIYIRSKVGVTCMSVNAKHS